MKLDLTIGLDGSGADKALRAVERYEAWREQKIHELVKRLAEMGAKSAQVSYDAADYDGDKDIKVDIKEENNTTYAVIATGHATLFVEFGAGIGNDGHPAQMYEMGSWSESPQGKGHWDNPPWYYAHGKTSSGNPPSKSMYDARTEVGNKIGEIAREVFG